VTVIRSWLGHARLDTTNHYARANLETKRKAHTLLRCFIHRHPKSCRARHSARTVVKCSEIKMTP
jgi:hypothetical protein